MLFNSWQFAVFLPVVFALYWALPHKFRIYVLFVSSYWFYMSWNAKYVVLILFTTIISYMAAILIERNHERIITKRVILISALVSCLGVLFVFKYFNFFMNILTDFMKIFAVQMHPMTLKLLLPVGISFYTFQTLSYVIDVYKGTTEAEHDFIVYSTFVSFFPQLVAGPIERSSNLLPQIKARHEFNYEQGTYGLKLIGWGLFKKIIIADTLAVWVDAVYGNVMKYNGFALVLATVFFTLQIYCDFSGYSDIARGTAKLFGIELIENFRSPYFASSIREYWSRWHISLSRWFKDYVYIPLGGSRVSKLRHYRNIMIVFLTSGLWHGADWTYVIWGGIHGIASIIEKIFTRHPKNYQPHGLERIIRVLVTFTICVVSRIFYRAANFTEAFYVFSHSLDGITNITSYIQNGIADLKDIQVGLKKIAVMIIILALYDYASFNENFILRLNKKPVALRWSIYVSFVFLLILCGMLTVKRSTEFIYFQF